MLYFFIEKITKKGVISVYNSEKRALAALKANRTTFRIGQYQRTIDKYYLVEYNNEDNTGTTFTINHDGYRFLKGTVVTSTR